VKSSTYWSNGNRVFGQTMNYPPRALAARGRGQHLVTFFQCHDNSDSRRHSGDLVGAKRNVMTDAGIFTTLSDPWSMSAEVYCPF
jgi:hypothetical protein